MFSQTMIGAVALALFSSANAHMFMKSPVPIQGNAIKDPLDPSGSNFPCHGSAPPTSGGQSMAAGSSQILEFDLGAGANTAVHGGGSCQLSITYETDPAKLKDPSSWKVLHSIIGGCPSNTKGNLGNTGAYACGSAQAPNSVDCVNSFNYTIPEGMKNGQATIAWTWFNTIGNREMYMNCAAVSITGGSNDDTAMSSLPSMFVANLASVNKCPTTENTDVVFPNPGGSVETKLPSGPAAASAVTYAKALPTGAGCDAGSGSNAAPSSSAAAPGAYTGGAQATSSASSSAAASSAAVSSAAPTSAAAPTYGQPSNDGGVLAPGASGASSSAAPSSAAGSGAAGSPATATSMITVIQTITAGAGSAIGSSSRNLRPSRVSSAPAVSAPASSAPAASAPASSAAPAAPSASAPSSSNNNSNSCTNGAVPCSTQGEVVCMQNNQWGLCNWGCAVPMPVAPGMACVNGAYVGAKQKRHPHGIAHRRSPLV